MVERRDSVFPLHPRSAGNFCRPADVGLCCEALNALVLRHIYRQEKKQMPKRLFVLVLGMWKVCDKNLFFS